MVARDENIDPQLSIEERRLLIDENRLRLDNSFARKWLPTLVTLMVGLIAAMFSYVQQQNAIQATERARIEAKIKDEREWGFKVIEMYFNKHDLFDLTKSPEQAGSNLRVLAAVAPTAVQGVLNAEQSRIPPPSGTDDSNRLISLSAVAGVQDVLDNVKQVSQAPASQFQPSDFTVYLQYPEGSQDTALKAQNLLVEVGFRVPGIEKVNKPPSRLQVRYYRPNQRTYAEALAIKLGKALDQPTSADNAILVTSQKQLPGGILELWLPPR
jgi:hypothetical protein